MSLPLTADRMDWNSKAKGILKAEIARRHLTCMDLVRNPGRGGHAGIRGEPTEQDQQGWLFSRVLFPVSSCDWRAYGQAARDGLNEAWNPKAYTHRVLGDFQPVR
jgi:hypothetical protein